MEITEHLTAVRQEGKLFAEAARQGGLDARIEHCPDWVMRDLVRHLCEIHLWAAAHVARRAEKMGPDDFSDLSRWWPELGVFWPADDELVDHYVRTNANLAGELESAAEDLATWTFLPAPTPRAMWARRQAHEIAVHRFDAQHAADIDTTFDPTFAADGIDEIIGAFAPRWDEFPIDAPRTMGVHTTDTDDHWHMTLAPYGITTRRDDCPTDVTLTGRASDLYLSLWNRGDEAIEVAGDGEILEAWHKRHRVIWTNDRD